MRSTVALATDRAPVLRAQRVSSRAAHKLSMRRKLQCSLLPLALRPEDRPRSDCAVEDLRSMDDNRANQFTT